MFGRGLGDTYVVFVLPLEREYGWTRSQLTSVYSIYLLMHGFTSPLVGLVFDRLGPRWVYTTGLACMCVAFFLAAGLSNLWQFYLFVGGMIGIGVSLTGMVPGSATPTWCSCCRSSANTAGPARSSPASTRSTC